MNDSDSCDYEMVSSQPEKKVFSVAPEDQIFKFRIQPISGMLRKFGYQLKKGTKLPHSASIGGADIEFIIVLTRVFFQILFQIFVILFSMYLILNMPSICGFSIPDEK